MRRTRLTTALTLAVVLLFTASAVMPATAATTDGSGQTSPKSGSTTPGGWGNNDNSLAQKQPPAAYAGTEYKNQQPLQITLPNGQKVTVLGDVFGSSPTDGRMALDGNSLSKEVRAALDAAGIPKEGSTYLINKAYGMSGVQLAWQRGTGQSVNLDDMDLAIIDFVGGVEGFVNLGYTSFNSVTPWGPGGIATLTLSNPSGSGKGRGSGGGGGGGGGGRTLASTEYHGTVSVSKTPKYVFTAWHRRPSGELCDMKVDVSWSNFRKVVYYSDGSSDEIPVKVTKVEAYHIIERYDDKGQMYVWPVETLASSLGSSGHVKHLWQYERAGKPGSMVYYLLHLETGDAIEVTFEVPVNGFSTTYLNPDEAEEMADKIAPTWWCSPRDSQTVNF